MNSIREKGHGKGIARFLHIHVQDSSDVR